jgi:NTE family protein
MMQRSAYQHRGGSVIRRSDPDETTIADDAAAMRSQHERHALVLQGGGALGAYQAGVYEALSETPYVPQWVAGVSIGAINAAIIAGNPPKRRVERLREFWLLVSSHVTVRPPPLEDLRAAFNQLSALWAATVGVPGFYRPHLLPAPLHPKGSEPALGIYDTDELRRTLERLVDFDLINRRAMRLSVGAVNVETGNSVYFDNFVQRIGPEHIMASGALPPAFAPTLIDGVAYWDGGIVSNTPLQYVLDARHRERLLVLQVDLFSAKGPMPLDLFGVMQRHKDIMYSSRTRYNTDKLVEIHNALRAVANLIRKLPPQLRDDPDVRHLEARSSAPRVDVIHLIYRNRRYERDSKDYEFSRASVLEHWQAGWRDMRRTYEHPDWLARSGDVDIGVTAYDLAHDPCERHGTQVRIEEVGA